MSTNKTENYNLHAWVAGDDFLLSEMNENFAAIDDRAVRMEIGSYVGTGSGLQQINLGVTPRAVFVTVNDSGKGAHVGGLAIEGHPMTEDGIAIEEGGFRVCYGGSYPNVIMFNALNQTFHYMAFL